MGAGTGAVYGAGASEGDVAERAIGAATGAATGGILGPLGQQIGKQTGKYLQRRLGNRPGRQYRGQRDEDIAVGRLQEEFRDELRTTDPRKLRELESAGLPPSEAYRGDVTGRMTIADLPAMQGARTGVSQGYSSARRLAADRLEQRATTEYEELFGEMEDVLRGTQRADEMAANVQKITARREKPYYRDAGKQHIDADQWMADVLLDPFVKGVYNSRRAVVKTFVRNKRQGFTEADLMPAWDDLVGVTEKGKKYLKFNSIPTRHLHQLKQGLDKKSNWAASRVSATEKAYRTLAGRINDEVGALNRNYKIANRINHLGRQTGKAIIAGAKALRSSSDTAVRKEFNALSSALEKKAYRSGMLQELSNRVGEPEAGGIARYLSRNSSKRIRNALKAVFPDQESYNRFINRAKQEAGFRGVEDAVGVGGSQTVRAGEEVAKWKSGGGVISDVAGAAARAAAFGPFAAGGTISKYYRLLNQVKDKEIARQAANILFTSSPAEAQKAFDVLLRGGRRLSAEDTRLLQAIKYGVSGAATPTAGLTGGAVSGLLAQ